MRKPDITPFLVSALGVSITRPLAPSFRGKPPFLAFSIDIYDNLPNSVNEDRLREFFSQQGEVTDAKLMRTKFQEVNSGSRYIPVHGVYFGLAVAIMAVTFVYPKLQKVKKHQKNGKDVSMGFGFVEFDSVETATSVCEDLQGTVLDGHSLILQLCHSKKAGQASTKQEAQNTLENLSSAHFYSHLVRERAKEREKQ
ncbi:hypothetical protein MUK42_08678 [Musa troglodytarum]|uniref:RRM domain-containing protein n=1 Tax=Musa troglodytarum TaxID=320322 RepID=A0A9E7EER3_9LILI|nr:hypothetical protein MUK42_08678 [Musa troglodytarum]